ncbi:hypothetical protein PYCCODRAFT_796996 [Trametes coccinea BRFM310]|uniref:Uncharacterized protein n=1 Tax=Trametes coccinea (strain BRFM310) TaxID=1353009 RepID=A0A1Y2J1C7_TRAC3|nr:hypothetical protein PYCCODRAFT_796996 [Trametes coccinea BRFM310]
MRIKYPWHLQMMRPGFGLARVASPCNSTTGPWPTYLAASCPVRPKWYNPNPSYSCAIPWTGSYSSSLSPFVKSSCEGQRQSLSCSANSDRSTNTTVSKRVEVGLDGDTSVWPERAPWIVVASGSESESDSSSEEGVEAGHANLTYRSQARCRFKIS